MTIYGEEPRVNPELGALDHRMVTASASPAIGLARTSLARRTGDEGGQLMLLSLEIGPSPGPSAVAEALSDVETAGHNQLTVVSLSFHNPLDLVVEIAVPVITGLFTVLGALVASDSFLKPGGDVPTATPVDRIEFITRFREEVEEAGHDFSAEDLETLLEADDVVQAASRLVRRKIKAAKLSRSLMTRTF